MFKSDSVCFKSDDVGFNVMNVSFKSRRVSFKSGSVGVNSSNVKFNTGDVCFKSDEVAVAFLPMLLVILSGTVRSTSGTPGCRAPVARTVPDRMTRQYLWVEREASDGCSDGVTRSHPVTWAR